MTTPSHPTSRARRLLAALLGTRPPATSGTLRLAVLKARVTIRRDAFGIAYIAAERLAADLAAFASVLLTALVTRRGPIISPALEGVARAGALSLRATWLDPRPAVGLLGLHRVRTFAEFRSAFRHWPAIGLNLVYADTAGYILWQLVGDTRDAAPHALTWCTLPQYRAGLSRPLALCRQVSYNAR